MMNRFICIPLCLFLLSVCNPKKNERPNGWYYITDRVEDSISSEPIVTINDFEEIKLDSAENLKRISLCTARSTTTAIRMCMTSIFRTDTAACLYLRSGRETFTSVAAEKC